MPWLVPIVAAMKPSATPGLTAASCHAFAHHTFFHPIPSFFVLFLPVS
jgi:hypothetical protein